MRGVSSIVDDSGAMHERPGGGTDVAIGCVNQWGPSLYVDTDAGSSDSVWARASCQCK
jgi:hypothetical protein